MITSKEHTTCLIEEQLTKTTPFRHQAEIIEATKDKPYFGLFMEQGTGKSHVTIATFTHLYRTGKIDGVLILAPNGVHDNWIRNEIPIHCAVPPHEISLAVWHGSDGKKKRAIWEWCCSCDSIEVPFVVLAANIEATRTSAFVDYIRTFMLRRRFLLVVDESTVVKNPKADQTRETIKIAKNASYTRILSGTPITQSPLDLWAQCRVLNELALPYPSYTAFKHTFAVEQVLNFGHRSFNKVVGYQNQDLLAKLISPFTVRVLKKDCLDLPDKIYQTRYVELTPEQRRIYRDLTKQCLATLEPGMVTVTTAITMMLRLHQVTLGYVQADDGVMRQIEHNRIKTLMDLLEENTSKAIIFCRFVEDVNQVAQAIGQAGKEFVVYYGGVGQQDRVCAVDEFQGNPEIRYFIATNAAAKGLTLTAAEQVIYYSQGFSLETRLQSEDRAHRIGQVKNVVYTDFISPGTVDEKVITALRQKKELADGVLDRTKLTEILSLEE